MRPANTLAKAECRALAANAEMMASGFRLKIRKLAAKPGAHSSDSPILKQAVALHKVAVAYQAASRAYYDAAFEFGLGNDARGLKRKNDGLRHVAAAKAANL